MSKNISLVFAAFLTIVAAGFWLKSSVSETAARSQFEPVKALLVYDLDLKTELKSLPSQNMDDKTFVFTETD